MKLRCGMWAMSGTEQNFVGRMMDSLPLTSDVCQDFQYDSIRSETDLRIPVQFDESTFMVLYEVMKFKVCLLYTSPSPRDRG